MSLKRLENKSIKSIMIYFLKNLYLALDYDENNL